MTDLYEFPNFVPFQTSSGRTQVKAGKGVWMLMNAVKGRLHVITSVQTLLDPTYALALRGTVFTSEVMPCWVVEVLALMLMSVSVKVCFQYILNY